MKKEFECDDCMENFHTEEETQHCPNCGSESVTEIVRDLNQEEDTLSV